MCVPYWWCTKHAQLIMGTWPIYKKHFLQLILTKKNKKNLSFDKISPRDFYFFSFLFNLYLWSVGFSHLVKSLHWRHNDRDGVSNYQPTIVYSTVYSGADQRKHQSSASLAFVRRIHRWPVNSPHKEPVTRKMFPFDDVIRYVTRLPPNIVIKWYIYTLQWHFPMWI